jgi:amidase
MYFSKKIFMKSIILLIILLFVGTDLQKVTVISPWVRYDESAELAGNAKHPSEKMRFRLIQSKILDKNDIWKNVAGQIANFSEEDYIKLKPFILEQDIPSIQSHIKSGDLTYEKLTQWYLYRIVKFENNRNTTLNNIISINPDAVNEARNRDRNKSAGNHQVYGMPILLKDNIDFEGLPATAGASALLNNYATDAFIVKRIKEKGGIILGKVNLSEWANYLSAFCPNGYSAVGGQTLNPYGRRIFDTGGSSSGSGTSMAANYAAAAVGTETSGSILSPSSANSIVGLKPTVGLLSRGGIIPISGTLDTPGPMTRNVTDNAILLSAMSGEDVSDEATRNNPKNVNYPGGLRSSTLKGLRFGVPRSFLTDSLYKLNIEKIRSLGGVIVEFDPEKISLPGFSTLLSGDMKTDLPDYLKKYGSREVKFRSVAEIYEYNNQDSLIRIPYGQTIFKEIIALNIQPDSLDKIRTKLHENGLLYFDKPMKQYQLDAILSINNRSASYAAVAKFPCLTVPMGYRKTGEPAGMTFIARPFEEEKLLKIGYAFEQATKCRVLPGDYK